MIFVEDPDAWKLHKPKKPFNHGLGVIFLTVISETVMYPRNWGLLELFILISPFHTFMFDILTESTYVHRHVGIDYQHLHITLLLVHELVLILFTTWFAYSCYHIDIYKCFIVYRFFFSCSLSYLTKNIKGVPKCSFEGGLSHTSRTPGSNVR